MMEKLIVVAGTGDARNIILELSRRGIALCATVATPLGKEFLRGVENIDVREGRRDVEGFLHLIRETGASCLVDASHPYAAEVSKTAMEACKAADITYLRYEREASLLEEGIIRVENYEIAVEKLQSMEGNILLTIGTNNLGYFTALKDYKTRVFARVLPDSRSVARCESLGFTASNILALKGPFSEEMNSAMIRHCNASIVVTKDSGKEGGVEEKAQSARRMGIPLMVIARPEVQYANKFGSVKELLEYMEKQE